MLHEDIKNQLKDAMKNKETTRLNVIRGILTSLTNELVATNRTPQDTLEDDQVLSVITRLAKQRKESITQFESAGRDDLAATEKEELAILETYLPEMMSKEEIQALAEAKKSELGIDDKSKAGMLIGALMKELKGKADGGDVKAVVDELLG